MPPLLGSTGQTSAKSFGFLKSVVAPVGGPYYMGYYGFSGSNILGPSYHLPFNSSNIYLAVCNSNLAIYAVLDSSLSITSQKAITPGSNANGYTSCYVDSSSNTYLSCGLSGSKTSNFNKIASGGASITWSRTLVYGGTWYSTPQAVTTDASGNVYACGRVDDASGNYRGYVAKWNSSGTLQWQSAFPATLTYCYFYDIVATANGVYVGGSAGPNSNYLMKLNVSTGAITWSTSFYDNTTYKNGEWWGLVLDSSENIYAVGALCPSNGYNDCCAAKFNSSGTLQWVKRYPVSGTGVFSELFTQVAITPDEAYIYCVGYGYNPATSGQTPLVMKLSTSTGAFQWGGFLRSSGSGMNTGYGVACDNSQFYMTASFNDGTYSKIFVAKLPGDGSKTGAYTVGSLTVTYSSMATPSEVTTSTAQTITNTPTSNPFTGNTVTNSIGNASGSVTISSAL